MKNNVEIRPDWQAVEIDETDLYAFEEADKPLIEKVTAVYFFDRNEITFLCSAQKNYYLRGLYVNVYVKADVPEAEKERVQERYSADGLDDDYFTVDRIDPLPAKGYNTAEEQAAPFRCVKRDCRWHGDDVLAKLDPWGDVNIACPKCKGQTVEENRDDAETVREHWQGNCPF
jgi:hypothetical protein